MVEQVIKSVVLPAIVAAVVLVIGWRPWRRVRFRGEAPAPCEHGHWSTALAFALAFGLSFVSKNWPSWSAADGDGAGEAAGPGLVRSSLEALQPSAKSDWLVYLGLAAGVIGLLAALVRRPKWLVWLAGPLVAAAVWIVIRPIENPTHALGGLPALCGVTFVLWLLLEPLAGRRPGASLPLAMLPVFTGISILIGLTGGVGISVGMICGAMAAVCGAAVLIAWLNPAMTFARGATPLLAAVPAAILWLQAWYIYGETRWFAFPLPLLAIPLLWLGELPVVTKRPPWVGALVRAVLAAIPAAVAVVLAMNASEAEPYSDLY